MAKKTVGKKSDELITLDQIKRLGIAAMFSDDELMDQLVLKGGNAMAIIHKLTSRESVDLDFSMRDDFRDGTAAVQRRIEAALQRTFRTAGYEPFDFKMEDRPASVSPDLVGFWGGYAFEFKLVPSAQHAQQKDDLARMQRSALSIGRARRFIIEISRFEYVDDKEEDEVEGHRIYVYSPLMIACEKLRAICQQMNEYSPVVRRSRPPAERARDFLDIHTLVKQRQLNLLEPKALYITRQMFDLKHVELDWLGNINNYREFHRQGFQAVQATVSRDFDLQGFDFYVDFVVKLANEVLTEIRAAAPA